MVALPICAAMPGAALAHATDQAFVLLLPTGVYTAVGVIVVAATFLLTLMLPAPVQPHAQDQDHAHSPGRSAKPQPRRCGAPPMAPGHVAISLLSTALVFALLFAGLLGSRDPLANPLPLTFWALFWVGFVSLTGIAGSVWHMLNPWSGLLRVLSWLGVRPALDLPGAMADGVALVSLMAFAGFLLADPAPSDPARLAFFGALYWGATLLGALVFGPRWLTRAELFAALLGWFGRLSPFDWQKGRAGWPGWQIVTARGSAAFLLLPLVALGVGSFDGLNETFLWLGWLGLNPLEFPGRSAVVTANALGLAMAVTLLVTLYFLAALLGQFMAGAEPGAALRLAPCVLPIALAYHVAHYLPGMLVDLQYVAGMLARLAGLPPPVVTTGFFFDPVSVRLIWIAQGTAVVLGHVHAIVLAHLVALRIYGTRRRAILSQLPMGAFMIAYTFFGLWLLAAPKGA